MIRNTLVLLVGITALGCGSKTDAIGPGSGLENKLEVLEGKLKLKDGDGKELFTLEPKADGAKLVDAADAELARYTTDGSKIKIKGPDDRVLGYITGDLPKFKIKSADQSKTLFALRRQEDGDFKLEDASGKTICKLKRRDYGVKAVDAGERELFKVKTKGEKSSLRDPDDTTRYSTKEAVGAMPMACLGLPRLDREQRVGLVLKLTLAGVR